MISVYGFFVKLIGSLYILVDKAACLSLTVDAVARHSVDINFDVSSFVGEAAADIDFCENIGSNVSGCIRLADCIQLDTGVTVDIAAADIVRLCVGNDFRQVVSDHRELVGCNSSGDRRGDLIIRIDVSAEGSALCVRADIFIQLADLTSDIDVTALDDSFRTIFCPDFNIGRQVVDHGVQNLRSYAEA